MGRDLRFGTWFWVVACMSALLVSSFLAAADLPDSASINLPPVAIEDPLPQTPLEAAGTGITPAADVTIHISAGGGVDEVEVRDIHPKTDFDAFYRTALEETLRRWRFAPALVDGKATASTLKWQLEFRPPIEQGAVQVTSDPGVGLGPGLLLDPEMSHRKRLYRIYTLPIEKQQRYLRELTEKAETFLDPARTTKLRSPLVRVITDHPDGEQAARVIAGNAQAVLGTLQQALCRGIPVEPPVFRIQIVVYSRRTQYSDFIEAVDGIRETRGMFIPPGLIVYHSELPSNEALLSVLVHEMVHAFVARYLLRPGVVLPRWFAEGLADYFSNSPVEKGKLILGKRRRTQFYRAPMRLWRGRTEAEVSLKSVWSKIVHGKALQVSALFSAGRDAFYGERMSEYYAQSWLLVHFLRQGKPEWTEESFPSLLLYAAEGYDPRAVIDSLYSMSPEELEAAYRRHVKKF